MGGSARDATWGCLEILGSIARGEAARGSTWVRLWTRAHVLASLLFGTLEHFTSSLTLLEHVH